MAKRLLPALPGLAAALLVFFPQPASALEFGGWYGRATLDAWHDDNLARQTVPRPTVFPRGNTDMGGNVGLALGSAFLVTPDMELWLTGSARFSQAVVYPEWGGASGALFADLSWRFAPATSSYVSLGSSLFWGGSPFHYGELGLEQRLWPGAWAFGALNMGRLASDRAELAFWMPGASLGVQQALPTGTRLAVSYGYQQRLYAPLRVEPQHQAFVLASQRLWPRVELRARYGHTLATAPAASYRNGFFSVGLALEL